MLYLRSLAVVIGYCGVLCLQTRCVWCLWLNTRLVCEAHVHLQAEKYTRIVRVTSMMKCIMASPIECSELSQALELRGSSVLLIDCRSFMDFNCCHISNAHNVHFPPIVKRRSGGSVRLERHILRCPRTRARLQAAHYSLVVVYDHNSTSLADLAEDSNMYLVLRCLSSEDRIHNLRYLAGMYILYYFLSFLI